MPTNTINSRTVARLLADAGHTLNQNRLGLARQQLDQLLALEPEHAEAHRLMGIIALLADNAPTAIEHLYRAVAADPDNAVINMTLGTALFQTDRPDEALVYLRRASELAPADAEAWYNLGRALQVSSHMQQASAALQHAVDLAPRHAQARSALATVLSALGQVETAVAILRETLRQQPDSEDAWFALGNVKTERLTHSDVTQLQTLLARPQQSDHTRILLGFTLAKGFEDQADWQAAFDTVSHANTLMRRHLQWDRNAQHTKADAVALALGGPLPGPLDPALGKEVIFVVSQPRSGSTLVEQILAAHPDIDAGGEMHALPDVLQEESTRRGLALHDWARAASAQDWHRLGEDYLGRTGHLLARRPRFTDKYPGNWAFVGAIAAMLPGAHVVNAQRDPLETCFSCFRQLFTRGCLFSYDLDDMVSYYADYDRLSRLWRQKFPRLYYDHSYEQLQQDPEAQIRRLLDFCDLPFDARCLAWHRTSRTILTVSSAQVRQPLRQDTARSAAYGNALEPLRARLRQAGLLAAGARRGTTPPDRSQHDSPDAT